MLLVAYSHGYHIHRNIGHQLPDRAPIAGIDESVRTYSYYAPEAVPRDDDKAFSDIARILEKTIKEKRSNKAIYGD